MTKFFETVHSLTAHPAPIGEGKFGAKLLTFSNGEKGVLKAKPFATDNFRGIPKQELPKREAAAYVLDHDILDFGVVPETLCVRWNGRESSIQNFIVSGMMPRDVVPGLFDRKLDDWKYRVAKLFVKLNLDDMMKVTLLDLIMNNVDRHGRNILIDPASHRVWAIDNGLAFGRYYRGYRSIFHKYLYYARLHIPEWALAKLGKLERADLDPLTPYLTPECVEDTWLRIQFVLDHSDRLAYKRMAGVKGFGVSKFPSYEGWFRRKMQEQNDGTALVYSPQATVDAKLG